MKCICMHLYTLNHHSLSHIHRHTIKRFARLLEQVAHKGTDKALFPNVLSLLGPSFAREELAELVAGMMQCVVCVLSVCVVCL
jgi:hypothetical protein